MKRYLEIVSFTLLLLSIISYKMMEDVRGQDPRARIDPPTVKVMCTDHV
jgi:hypothetical protein